MWKEHPGPAERDEADAPQMEHDDEEGDEAHDSDAEEQGSTPRRQGPQLRDNDGFCYFGPVRRIHELLDVELYRPAVSYTHLRAHET